MSELEAGKQIAMSANIRRCLIGSLMVLAVSTAVVSCLSVTTISSCQQLAARYHLRTRTGNFYQRASRSNPGTRSSGTAAWFRVSR